MTVDERLPEGDQAAPVKAKPQPQRQLRLWPGLVIPVLILTVVFLPGFFVPGTMIQFMGMMIGPLGGMLTLVLWWLFLSRAAWSDRFLLFSVFIVGAIAAKLLSDVSMGLGLLLFGFPTVVFGFAAALSGTAQRSAATQRVVAVLAILCGWGFWTLVRLDGLDGRVFPTLSWRWTETAEQRYLMSLPKPAAAPADDVAVEELVLRDGDWPGFRGPARDGRFEGPAIAADWKVNPPKEVWRRPIGPAWSSFAVVGNRLFTQEQRGEEEVVLCLDAETGDEVWSHKNGTRFWEVIGGAGPRATPTFDEGKIYAMGANGNLNCLDAVSGELVWSRNVGEDGKSKPPTWGFASSPLVLDQRVYVFAGGGDNSLLAYDKASGNLEWAAGDGLHTYSSPQLATFGDARQIMMVTEAGAYALAPESGELLWRHEWPVPGYRVVQPHLVDGGVLLGTHVGMGTRRLQISQKDDQWSVEEKWTSRGLKPYFNDFVVHNNHAYGFDNNILVCLNLDDGERRWKGGRYGAGQMLLLAQQDLLLVTTEKSGEIVLVDAKPDGHAERTRFKVFDGKNWNHPVLVGNRLYIRNGEEAACLELANE